MAGDSDPHVRARAAELVGKFAHTDIRAVTALETSRAHDPNPTVRKKAGWFAPGGPVHARTAPRARR
nr:HEAT repeat domain-containing protein [Actinacidiphila acididurans]